MPAFDKLSGNSLKWFMAEAIAYRCASNARKAFRDAIKPFTDQAKKAAGYHIGPWLNAVGRFLHMDGPERWVACTECNGTGMQPLFGGCPRCFGHGYHI